METENQTMEPESKKGLGFYGTIVIAAILAILIIANVDGFNRILGKALFYLRPVIIGLSIAYLSNPFFRLYEQKLLYRVNPFGLRRFIAMCMTYLTLFLILAILLLLIVPQLITSILEFVENAGVLIDSSVKDINPWIERINRLISDEGETAAAIPLLNAEKIKASVATFLSTVKLNSKELMDHLNLDTLGTFFNLANNVLTLIADIIFGIFISIYLLNTKEKRYAQIMRARRAVFSDSFNERLTEICTVADHSFGGFLRGKLLDSSIVGVLVYISISIIGVPYAILIAAIVAITDIVPIIGPFIGVAPSAVIILLTDPAKVIPFLLCILVIQQIDGNIIAPKILGENTGVSSLCVMIAITTMGTLWGLAGMVLGVPLFATVLELTNRGLDKRLAKKGLPTLTDSYYAQTMSEDETGEPMPTNLPATETAEAPPHRFSMPAEGGVGDVSELECFALNAYDAARRLGLLDETNEDDPQLAEEPTELERLATELFASKSEPETENENEEASAPSHEDGAEADDSAPAANEPNDVTDTAPEPTSDPINGTEA